MVVGGGGGGGVRVKGGVEIILVEFPEITRDPRSGEPEKQGGSGRCWTETCCLLLSPGYTSLKTFAFSRRGKFLAVCLFNLFFSINRL